VPAIFIGLNLHKAFVPSWATWIMTAFVLFHLIVELLLEIHGCLNARKQKRTYTSRPTISSRPSDPLSTFFLAPQIQLQLTIVHIYELYLLTSVMPTFPLLAESFRISTVFSAIPRGICEIPLFVSAHL